MELISRFVAFTLFKILKFSIFFFTQRAIDKDTSGCEVRKLPLDDGGDCVQRYIFHRGSYYDCRVYDLRKKSAIRARESREYRRISGPYSRKSRDGEAFARKAEAYWSFSCCLLAKVT